MIITNNYELLKDKTKNWINNHMMIGPHIVLSVFAFFINTKIEATTLFQFVINYIKILSIISFFYFLFFIVVILFDLAKREYSNLKQNLVVLCIVFVISIPYIPKVLGYGTTQIGSYYEKTEYIENYVVFMSREPQTKNQRKVYTLPSEIFAYYDGFHGSYYIQKLYFNNGGYLNFDEQESDYTILVPSKECSVRDNKGDQYYITLTRTKAPK